MNTLTLEKLRHMALQNNPTLKQIHTMTTKTIGTETLVGASLQQNKLALDSLLIRMQNLRVLNAVTLLYYETVAAQAAYKIQKKYRDCANDIHKLVIDLRRKGYRDRLDLPQAKIELWRSEMILNTLENVKESLWKQLAAVVGKPELGSTVLEDTLVHPPPEIDCHEALQRVLQQSPEITIAQICITEAQQKAQDENTKEPSATSQILETLSNPGVEPTEVSPDSVSIADIPYRNRGDLLINKFNIAYKALDLRRIELSLRKRFSYVFESYSSAKIRAQTIADMLPVSKKTFKSLCCRYADTENDTNVPPFSQLKRAQLSYFSMEFDYIQALLEQRQSYERIDGLLFENGLTAPFSQPYRKNENLIFTNPLK